MKKVILVCIVSCCCVGRLSALNLAHIRALFFQSVTNKASVDQSFLLLKNVTVKDDPVLFGYKAMSYIMMAKHAVNPVNKYRYFKIGKNQLEEAIRMDVNSIELRFIRLTVQTNVPSFLAYNAEIVTDKEFILKSIHSMKEEDLKIKIANYLITSNLCNVVEKNAILNQ